MNNGGTASNERTPLLNDAAERDQNIVPGGGESLLPEPNVPIQSLSKTLSYGSDGYGATWHPEPADEVESQRSSDTPKPEFLGGVTKTQFWLIFGCTLFQYFVATFDSTLMASSHPVITSYFHASNAASWLSTSFLLTSTSFSPLFGRVSDTVGRRLPYILSFTILLLATLWCALAQSIGSFIAARALCGFGAGGVLAMGSILTNDLVPIEVRGTYQAYINIFYGLGSACGAAFGGTLCEKIGWRWAFGGQIPFMFAILCLAWLTIPSSLGPHLAKNSPQSALQTLKSFDLSGSFFLTVSAASLILGLNLGGNIYPWDHPLVISSLVIAGVSIIILLRIESKALRPVMPLTVIFETPRGQLIFSNFFCQIGFSTIIFNLPIYFQAVQLESPTASGLRLAPGYIASTVVSVTAGFIITITRRMKPLIVVGAFSGLAGTISLACISRGLPAWVVTCFLVPCAIGQGLIFPTVSVAVLAASTQDDQAVTQSSLTLFRSLGLVMGVCISSLILQNSLVVYLNQFVTGKHKAEIILMVRKSVHAVKELSGTRQSEVIESYLQALRLTLLLAVFGYGVATFLLLPLKVKRLARR